jgi:hypothetical protein
VSTVSATEWIYRKQYAARIYIGGTAYQAEEFTMKLSHNQLQDIVTQIFRRNEGNGKNKLVVSLEQMVENGVLSESAYNHGDANVEVRFCLSFGSIICTFRIVGSSMIWEYCCNV